MPHHFRSVPPRTPAVGSRARPVVLPLPLPPACHLQKRALRRLGWCPGSTSVMPHPWRIGRTLPPAASRSSWVTPHHPSCSLSSWPLVLVGAHPPPGAHPCGVPLGRLQAGSPARPAAGPGQCCCSPLLAWPPTQPAPGLTSIFPRPGSSTGMGPWALGFLPKLPTELEVRERHRRGQCHSSAQLQVRVGPSHLALPLEWGRRRGVGGVLAICYFALAFEGPSEN